MLYNIIVLSLLFTDKIKNCDFISFLGQICLQRIALKNSTIVLRKMVCNNSYFFHFHFPFKSRLI